MAAMAVPEGETASDFYEDYLSLRTYLCHCADNHKPDYCSGSTLHFLSSGRDGDGVQHPEDNRECDSG